MSSDLISSENAPSNSRISVSGSVSGAKDNVQCQILRLERDNSRFNGIVKRLDSDSYGVGEVNLGKTISSFDVRFPLPLR